MKLPRTFLIALAACSALLLLQWWSPRAVEIFLGCAIMCALFGGFIWLFFQVCGEILSLFKTRQAKFTTAGALLLLVALTGILSFGYLWCAIAVVILGACLLWRGFQDYRDLFRRRISPRGPQDWHSLELGQLPAVSPERREQAKKRFAHSHDVRIVCTPRAGDLGFASHPLSMDE